MTEKKVRLSKAGAAVVAPFAHMQPDACTHTHSKTISELIHRKWIWAVEELSLPHRHTRAYTHTQNACTPIGWRLSTPPQESLRGLLQYSAPGAWKRWSEPFFPPSLLLFLGWISKVHSLPHFPLFSRILVPSVHCSYGIQFLLCR